ncbi:MAG: hypothetical protein WCC99_05540 [Candidatus Sulfotelmatobacter sp.]
MVERKKDSEVDIWGVVLLIASLACLETATSRGEHDLWFQSNWIPRSACSQVFFISFFWWDYRPENASPVLHLRTIVRHASLRSFFLVIMIVGAFFGAGLYVVPQYLRFVQDYSALQAGGFISMYTLGLGLGLRLVSQEDIEWDIGLRDHVFLKVTASWSKSTRLGFHH